MSADIAHEVGPLRDRYVAGIALAFVGAAFVLTAMAPLAVAVIAVFLFAGPHNYAEARYFVTRLPPKFGRLKPFFLLSAFGILSLSFALPCVSRLPRWMHWPESSVVWMLGIWNTLFLLWCAALVSLRSQQRPKRDWIYAWPIGLALAGVCWLQPFILPLGLVYLHPLMGLWILDGELRKSRPEWQAAFRRALLALPILVVLIWVLCGLRAADHSLFSPTIRDQVAQHVGGTLFEQTTLRKLIAVHAFLELLHYGVWLLAVPAASGKVFSRAFWQIPLMRRSGRIQVAVKWALAASAFVVVGFWFGFAADYRTTRDIYFTVATFHVLAEIPFLLRLI